jgi:hypothetical protein
MQENIKKNVCGLCNNNISNIYNTDKLINNLTNKKINKKNIYIACQNCINIEEYEVLKIKKSFDFSKFYLKIFINNNNYYVLSNEWKDFLKNSLYKNKEELRRKEIDSILREQRLDNIKPNMYASYVKFGVPNIETLISTFKREQSDKEDRLLKLIKELKKSGKEYDENIPMHEKYIKEGGDIKKIIEESDLEKSLIYNTNYKHYLKHNTVQIARYLATMEFMNSGKHNDVIKKFASEKNTLKFL